MTLSHNHPPIRISFLFPIFALLLVLFTTTITAQRIEKPAVFKDHWKDFDPVARNFGPASTPVKYHREEVRAGNFPAECVSEAKGKCDMSDMKAFKVTYDDCSEPWIFCHCQKAEVDLDHTIDIFSRVPVKARSYVKNVMLWPANQKAAAYAWSNNIGVHYPQINLFIMLHEVGHIIERGLSKSEEYKKALEGDTCVLTPYSQSSYGEAVGDLGAFVWYDGVDPEESKRVYDKWGMKCLGNQWALLKERIGPLFVPGGECPERVNRNTEFVRMRRESTKRQVNTYSSGGASGRNGKRALPGRQTVLQRVGSARRSTDDHEHDHDHDHSKGGGIMDWLAGREYHA
ncbi:hypothetical protein DFH27DRAFT_199773 [Peziza echinospora]|nr:hypothetical protein DFH27DRAFT_199773 [Peziza echinospora]